jgi:putative membrane protein
MKMQIRTLIAFVVALVVLGTILPSATFAGDKAAERAQSQAKAMFQAFMRGDADRYLDYTPPRLVELAGGKAKFIQTIRTLVANVHAGLHAEGFSIRSATAAAPQQIVRPRPGIVQVIIPTETVIVGPGFEGRQSSYLVGLSSDDGQTWKFVDTGGLGGDQFRKLFPECSRELKIPATWKSQNPTTSPDTTTTVKMSQKDVNFIQKAAGGGAQEVANGKMAEIETTSAEVKSIAARMVADHTRLIQELTALANRKGVFFDTSGVKAQNLGTGNLDALYLKWLDEIHKIDIAAFERQARSGDDSELKAWASKSIPTLRQHLAMAQGAEKKKWYHEVVIKPPNFSR